MKEQILEQALEIKKNLDKAREIKNNIEEKRSLCTGNTSEVRGRKFELSITDGKAIKKIVISSRAAHEALNIDFKNACDLVEGFKNELEQLN